MSCLEKISTQNKCNANPHSSEMPLRLFIWLGIFLILLIDVIGLHAGKIELALGDLINLFDLITFYILLFCALYYLSFLFRHQWAHKPTAKYASHCVILAVFLESACQFLCLGIVGFTFSYIAASSPLPYQDKYFLCGDRLLGLDWYHYVEWVNLHPWTGKLFFLSYASSGPQFFLLAALLAITGQFKRLYFTIVLLVISVTLCSAIAALLPATGIINYLHLNTAIFHNLTLGPGFLQVPALEQLRNGTFHRLDFSQATGLITFPSFHAASAFILAWAFWSLPWIRWPVLALNIMVIASTPVIGGHYFVDVIGGGGVVLLAFFVGQLIEKTV